MKKKCCYLFLLPLKLFLYAVMAFTGLTAITGLIPYFVLVGFSFEQYGAGLGFLAMVGIPVLIALMFWLAGKIDKSGLWDWPF